MTKYYYIDLTKLLEYDSVYEYLCMQFKVDLPYNENLDALYDKISEKASGEDVIIQLEPSTYMKNDDYKIIKTVQFLNKITQVNPRFNIELKR